MSDALRADALLAEMPREGRGRLKVFLGAAPGVGKTFAMLQAAQAQQRQGSICASAWSKPTAVRKPRPCSPACHNSRCGTWNTAA